jgi:cytochrome b561
MLPTSNDAARWGWVSITLHWVTVLAIIGLGIVGTQMDDLPTSLMKVKVYALHKSFGLTVLALTVLRLAWRWYAGAPALPPMPRWQRLAAHASHVALYALLLAMPLSGWVLHSASSKAGYALKWFGLFKVPAIAAFDPALKALAHELHEGLFKAILVVAAIHVAAAFKHHFLERDQTLHRMLPIVPDPSRKLAAPKGSETP